MVLCGFIFLQMHELCWFQWQKIKLPALNMIDTGYSIHLGLVFLINAKLWKRFALSMVQINVKKKKLMCHSGVNNEIHIQPVQ